VAKNDKTRFFYVFYSDKTWVFGPSYIITTGDGRSKTHVLDELGIFEYFGDEVFCLYCWDFCFESE